MINYDYSKKEIDTILKSLVVIVDSREQKNKHITDYFEAQKITYMKRALKTGDYSCFIPKNDDLGITRDIHLNASIERKNSIDELAQSITDRSRFENELIRASRSHFIMIVEDKDGYENLLNHNYRSQYSPKALLGSIKAFEVRYGFTTIFLDKKFTGNYINYHLRGLVNEYLKSGLI